MTTREVKVVDVSGVVKALMRAIRRDAVRQAMARRGRHGAIIRLAKLYELRQRLQLIRVGPAALGGPEAEWGVPAQAGINAPSPSPSYRMQPGVACGEAGKTGARRPVRTIAEVYSGCERRDERRTQPPLQSGAEVWQLVGGLRSGPWRTDGKPHASEWQLALPGIESASDEHVAEGVGKEQQLRATLVIRRARGRFAKELTEFLLQARVLPTYMQRVLVHKGERAAKWCDDLVQVAPIRTIFARSRPDVRV